MTKDRYLFRGFHKEENGKETIYIDGQVVKGAWLYGSLLHLTIGYRDLYYIVPKNTCYNEIDFCKGTINAIWEEQDFIEVIPETIGQYTGLEDKNGKKIFENDIVRLDDEQRRLISACNAKTEEDLVRKDCLVGFKDGAFMFCRNKYRIDDFDSYLWITNTYCEVVGNKFDNSELLDKEVK